MILMIFGSSATVAAIAHSSAIAGNICAFEIPMSEKQNKQNNS